MKEKVSGKTQIYGIIGDPIEHTVSPAMQNAAFSELGMDCIYLPFNVKGDDLRFAIQGLRALNIRGLNVTIPHKASVISLLDELDPLVESLEAVNTIVNSEGILKGYNTDASGFWRSLQSEKIDPDKKKALVLGAGGAARAICFMMADKGADMTILNRHLQAGQKLADRISGLFRREVRALELNKDNLTMELKDAEIIINTTSVGMFPNVEETLVPARLIKNRQIIIDIIYNPLQTRLIRDGRKRGAKTLGGIEMLVQQGAAAFEIWTGKKAPVDVMREAVIKTLNKNEN
jgi:shikimate dehydrogenase